MGELVYVIHCGSPADAFVGVCGEGNSGHTVFASSADSFFNWREWFPQDHLCELCALVLLDRYMDAQP